jgi:hypothetical protein
VARIVNAPGWLNRSRRLSKDFEALPETTSDPNRHDPIMTRRLAAKRELSCTGSEIAGFLGFKMINDPLNTSK